MLRSLPSFQRYHGLLISRISLVGIIYKMITKILANMLKMVLERTISKSQNASSKAGQFYILFLLPTNALIVD
jgi:hypothetical protein